MAEVHCEACETLKQEVPEFVVNGLDETMCASLASDTGLKPSAGHNDCTDLNNLNDCLIGNEETEIDLYEVCDWKEFMKQFIANLWTTLKAMICSICGMWEQIHCTWNSLVKLVNTLASTTGGVAFVRYYRDLGAGDAVPYWENVTVGTHKTLDIYMDSAGASSGSQPADRDYVVMISNCTNYVGFNDLAGRVTYYSSGDTRDVADIRSHQAQHPDFKMFGTTTTVTNFSWTTSGAVLLKAGEHVKVDFYVTDADKGSATEENTPKVRLHQFILTWIPINVEEPLDPSDILEC